MLPPRVRLLLASGALGVAFVATYLVLGAIQAERAMQQAERTLPDLQAAVLRGDDQRARVLLARLQGDAATAARATDGPLWTVVGSVPWVGRTVAQTTVLASTANQVMTLVAPPLLDDTASLRSVARGNGGSVDLAALRSTGAGVDVALAHVSGLAATVDELPDGIVLPPVAQARNRLNAHLHRLRGALQTLSTTSRVGPAMLGADRPRRYFVAFQNNAETRGTGGLVGAYAIIRAVKGTITVERLGSDLDLEDLKSPKVDLGPDFRRMYGEDVRSWQNTNMSGHFPFAARQWLDMWEQRSGERLDGAIATDPVALSYLLRTTGPVVVPGGTTVSADNVVAHSEYEIYRRYDGDDLRRKSYLVGMASAVLDRLLGPQAPARSELLNAVAKATGERRFMIWSAHPAEQAALSGTAVAGEVPAVPGPFAFLVLNNTAGNKADYFLGRSLTYELGRCRDGQRSSTVTAVLRNDVPSAPQPRFVTGRKDQNPGPQGSTSVLVSLYAPQGAALRSATVNGTPTRVFAGRERGHPVFVLRVELLRASPLTVALQLTEPASDRAPVVPVQSLVRDQVNRITWRPCR